MPRRPPTSPLFPYTTLFRSLVIDSRARSARAEVITQHLIIAVLLLGMGLAGLATYSILYPLRQVQQHIRQIGQGTFGQSVKDRKSTRLNSSHRTISYAVFCLNASSTTDFSTLSLHDALPISRHRLPGAVGPRRGHYPAPHHRRPPPRNGLGRACDLQHTVSVAPGAAAHPADRPRDVRTIRKRSEEHTSELQSPYDLVCRLLLECLVDHRLLHSFPTRRSSDLSSSTPGRGRPAPRSLPSTSSSPSSSSEWAWPGLRPTAYCIRCARCSSTSGRSAKGRSDNP